MVRKKDYSRHNENEQRRNFFWKSRKQPTHLHISLFLYSTCQMWIDEVSFASKFSTRARVQL